VDGECADGAGKQHSSRSVMLEELLYMGWMSAVDGEGKEPCHGCGR
jgi:hypothetical protein